MLTIRVRFPQNLIDLANGVAKYPWEEKKQGREWDRSRARATVEACLHRDAAKRLTAKQLLAAVKRMGHSTSIRADDDEDPSAALPEATA